MSNYNEIKHLYLECEVTIEEEWKSNPPRTEECHGYHTFDEDELQNEQVIKVELLLDAETTIDITSRLTKEELALILKD